MHERVQSAYTRTSESAALQRPPQERSSARVEAPSRLDRESPHAVGDQRHGRRRHAAYRPGAELREQRRLLPGHGPRRILTYRQLWASAAVARALHDANRSSSSSRTCLDERSTMRHNTARLGRPPGSDQSLGRRDSRIVLTTRPKSRFASRSSKTSDVPRRACATRDAHVGLNSGHTQSVLAPRVGPVRRIDARLARGWGPTRARLGRQPPTMIT
jgi:hypothetical protein